MSDQILLKPLPSITFGAGSIASLPKIAASFGQRCLIISGGSFRKRASQWPRVEKELHRKGCELFYASIESEPSPQDIDSVVGEHRALAPDTVIAIGGGSVLDGGKAVSAMLPTGEPVTDFLEGVGSRTPNGNKTPFIAVPTTAGTGSEATANAVITKPGAAGFKKSLRHDRFVPDYAVIDPDLMRSCPPPLTAACAMDAFTQLVEGYLSTNASEITDTIAWEGIKNIKSSLLNVFHDGNDIDARSDLAFASLCSGIVLANAGLGIIHGIAPPLGSLFPVPHGVVCGTLMASGNEATVLKLLASADDKDPQRTITMEKYTRLDRLFCEESGSDAAPGMKFVEYLYDLTAQLDLPRLAKFGVVNERLDEIAAGSSNKNNPVKLDDEHIKMIVAKRI